MELVHAHCAALDVHKATVVACCKVQGKKVTKTFKTYVVIYHMVTRGTAYADLGADYQARQNRERLLKRRVKELGRLGYEVTVRVLEAA